MCEFEIAMMSNIAINDGLRASVVVLRYVSQITFKDCCQSIMTILRVDIKAVGLAIVDSSQ